MKLPITTTHILWLVYLSLLAALLPHTAWAFRQFEPSQSMPVIPGFSFTWADLVSYIVAFAFEAAIAALTHKLAKHIEKKARLRDKGERWRAQYLNWFSLGLGVATIVSAFANYAHAVQFGGSLKVFDQWSPLRGVYSVAFGGALPFVSLIFARVLSNVVEDDEQPNPDLEAAKNANAELRKQNRELQDRLRSGEERARVSEEQSRVTEARLQESEARVKVIEDQVNRISQQLRQSESRAASAEERARVAEERFGALGDLVKALFGEDKRQRIIFARQQWPQLPGKALAVITGTSESYVSEVLRDADQLIEA